MRTPRYMPEPVWEDEDVYVIGGGTSLASFDWSLLHGRHTIGCNAAFALGVDVCNICYFADKKWWDAFHEELAEYTGLVVTDQPQLKGIAPEWVHVMRRQSEGLGTNAIGFNSNSGCAATNLALILGAKRVLLLGFDMRLSAEHKPNWHDKVIDRANPDLYVRFRRGFDRVKTCLPQVFPGCEIINVTDGSNLDCFPKVGVAEHFAGASNGTNSVPTN